MIVLTSRTDQESVIKNYLLHGFGDVSGQRSKMSKTLKISNKSMVQARVMILSAFNISRHVAFLRQFSLHYNCIGFRAINAKLWKFLKTRRYKVE
jgi:hypothetical protein